MTDHAHHPGMAHSGHDPVPGAEHGGGHDKHAGHSVAMFRDKFWISLLLTIPTLVWGHMLQRAFGYTPPPIPGGRWIPALFGTAVFLYGGLPFVQGAIRELRDRLPGMMTLIALAITVAFVFSAAVTLGYPGMPLWEELATLVTIMLLGHWIEMRSITQAQGALAELARLLPDTAGRIVQAGGVERIEEVPVTLLREGDLILIRPGTRIPADGSVREGHSSVNESMITGESRPVAKNAADRVIAGTVNEAGSLRIEVTGTGEKTTLAGIMRLVEQAQQSRSRAQALADRAAFWLTLIALGSGAATFIAWLGAGAEVSFAVERLVTVLVIACPHALGLAVPLVIAISTTLGAQSGLLVRDRRGLEEARLLERGGLRQDRHPYPGRAPGRADVYGRRSARRRGAAARRRSRAGRGAPVARALVSSARERGIAVPRASGFPGDSGLRRGGELDGRRLTVGGPEFARPLGVYLPAELVVHRRRGHPGPA